MSELVVMVGPPGALMLPRNVVPISVPRAGRFVLMSPLTVFATQRTLAFGATVAVTEPFTVPSTTLPRGRGVL